ncbi:MAG: signal recognition particle protein [Ruminobacter sp.]|uniref:Signal recognition particle protein n=1 Tax=Ruminobacter amylophilus TaxID=867 RepID=A0A662ZHH6_9GAMM|nr:MULTISPECIES: signal recognition particle protein [Ruminobacter]MBQ3774656.1 signal recognition particle protein [Ruminobacter sp.]SFP35588.1 signal recognition particle subunit FFH/SRP54 (srp54) [Ruminobacter amylophilus]
MFENLTQRLTKTLRNITGQGKLTEDNIKDTLREVRMALLEADVALPVVKDFIAEVKTKALGQEVNQALNPGQEFVKIVFEELKLVMGDECAELNLATQPPAVVLMAGLQGAGKTTTVAKLAKYLKDREKKKVMVVSADVYRPAAIEQLKTLAETVGVEFFPSTVEDKPLDIVRNALASAKIKFMDVLLVDTAGRLHVDEDMMNEIKEIHADINPVETLFVVDAMTGQDAANTAKAFNDALPLTGIILTKMDGDARGGAALSVRKITGKPIKFLGAGEKIEALDPFHPERMASRILDMGDILSLVEEMERKVDKKQAEKLADKFKTGKDFDFDDFRAQIVQMRNMGGIASMLDKLPGMSALPDEIKDKVDDKIIYRKEAIINSMTIKERRHPEIIKASRKKRIADGAGVEVTEVTKLIREFTQMQHMMKRLQSKGGLRKMLNLVKDLMPAAGFKMPPQQ